MAGIIVFISKEYDEFVTRVSKDCSFAVFLNCNKRMFSTDKDVLLSFVYLPSQGSPFYNNTDYSDVMLFEFKFQKIWAFYNNNKNINKTKIVSFYQQC